MKRTVFLLVAGFIAAPSIAQTQKGYWLMGTSVGSTGFSSSNSKSTYSNTATEYNSKGHSFSLSLNPSAMYFINDNIAVGGAVGIGLSTSKSENSNTGSANVSTYKSNSTSFSFGPQVRAYFGKTGSKGQPWIEGSAGISTNPGKSKSTNSIIVSSSEYDSRSNNWNAGANIGYSHFFNTCIAMNYFIGYRHYHYSGNSDVKQNPGMPYSYATVSNYDNINFGIGLQIHLASKAVKK